MSSFLLSNRVGGGEKTYLGLRKIPFLLFSFQFGAGESSSRERKRREGGRGGDDQELSCHFCAPLEFSSFLLRSYSYNLQHSHSERKKIETRAMGRDPSFWGIVVAREAENRIA